MMKQTLSVRDAVLHVESLGAGPIALLLHAGSERRRVWRPVMTSLAEQGFFSIAYDQRGHGESEGDINAPLPSFGADAAAIIDRLSIPVVVGCSLGGFAALSALADTERQRRVAGLILVDVLPDPDPARVRAFLGAAAQDPDRARHIDDILGRADELRAIAASLDMPVLLVRGGKSKAVDDDGLARFRKLVPHVLVADIPEAGHLVARERPGDLAKVIADFLSLDVVRDRRIARFLTQFGADTLPHPGGTLASHLHRTADTLRAWGASPALVDAARLHAAYGTDGFLTALADRDAREEVRAIVGTEAEVFIDLYCRCDRARSYPSWHGNMPQLFDRHTGAPEAISNSMRTALIELTVVNELDVLAHDGGIAARHGAALHQLFRRWHPFLSNAANATITATESC